MTTAGDLLPPATTTRGRPRGGGAAQSGADPRPDNEVFLRGQLTLEPTLRELANGEETVSFRLTVARTEGDRVRLDNIDCATTSPRVRACLERAAVGDELEVTGALRRRFWRGPAGLASKYEVLVSSARAPRRRRSGA